MVLFGVTFPQFYVPCTDAQFEVDRLKPSIKCQMAPDRNFISHLCEAANSDSNKFVHSLQAQKLKGASKVKPIPNSAHYTLPLMDCSFHLTMSLSFLQPSSQIKVWVICLHYLVYFLLCPISNGWKVAQRHKREEISVDCRQGKIHSLCSVCLQTRQICEVVIVMEYVVKAVKERIKNRKYYQSLSRGAQEMDGHNESSPADVAHGRSWSRAVLK